MARKKIGSTFLTYFWEEKPGIQSSIRIQMFLTLLFAFLITYMDGIGDMDVSDGVQTMLYIAAFTPKVLSKFGEGGKVLKDGRDQ